ncbi:MAG: hypothetical protein KF794_10240 [Xanthobacteraceae bacterium]|nr:MAG: hypothetical protein KF794_10240 [Xanthobacteraceae bacterium]
MPPQNTATQPQANHFIGALAQAMIDNVAGLQQAVDRVAAIAMEGGKPDRELIVAFQAFDRLKQEFEAVGLALRKLSRSGATASTAADAIGTITVSDLKNRLNGYLAHALIASADDADTALQEACGEDEQVF